MSRIGRKPIPIPTGVEVVCKDRVVSVKGPKASLSQAFEPEVAVSIGDDAVVVTDEAKNRRSKAMHGLYRQLISNMIIGVTKGFEKRLEIVGVGYRAAMEGAKLVLQIGFCHPVPIEVPKGLTVETPKPTTIIVTGADKQAVGQFAAMVRAVRKPEPYKGKGIRYADEQVRRLQGKSFAGK
jgi:large subunit ribosomal protein L6